MTKKQEFLFMEMDHVTFLSKLLFDIDLSGDSLPIHLKEEIAHAVKSQQSSNIYMSKNKPRKLN